MDSLQGLMNVSMVNNIAEAPEERSTVRKVMDALGAGGAVAQFLSWLLGNAAPAPVRAIANAATTVGYAAKAYDVLQNIEIQNQGNRIPFNDGGMTTQEYLGNTMTTRQYMDYSSSSSDTLSLFRREL